jgi:glycosyltransferase involved in cell wall biosynthesis
MRKKRILFIDISEEFGGAEVYLDHLVQLLDDYGELFALCSLPAISERLKRHRIRVLHFPALSGPLKGPRFLLAALVLPAILIWHRIDTIHINGSAESILLPVARLCGRGAISTRHLTFDMESRHWWQAPGRFAGRLLYRACGRFANRIVCVSDQVGHHVRKIVDPSKVVVIRNWLPEVKARANPGQFHDPIRVLCIGRLIEHKGAQLAINALRQFRNVSLTIVGTGPYQGTLENLAEGLDVTFAGFHHNPDGFYEDSDILIMPSLGPEGLPLVSLEGMANTLPCILSDIPVHKDITCDGQAALLFSTGDAGDLATKLQLLIEDKEARQLYALRGRKLFLERHTPGAVRDRYLAVFGLSSEPRTHAILPTQTDEPATALDVHSASLNTRNQLATTSSPSVAILDQAAPRHE